MVYDSYIILSSKVETLEKTKEAIEEDETWGKSRAFLNFNDHNLQESNFSVYLSEWDDTKTTPNFNFPFNSLEKVALTWASFQWSALDDSFYTNLSMEWAPNLTHSGSGNKATPIENTTATRVQPEQSSNAIIRFKPFYNQALNELNFILEKKGRLCLVNQQMNELWSLQIDGPIVEDIQFIDYYKNGKTQFLFATPTNLYLIDRLGRAVSNFPKSVACCNQFLQPVAYDQSGISRWLIAGAKNFALLNKNGNPLPDWDNRSWEDTLSGSPKHIRVAGQDFFLFLLTNGNVHLLKRNGQEQTPFPIQFNNPILPNSFVAIGKNMSSSFIYALTPAGEIWSASLDGKTFPEKVAGGVAGHGGSVGNCARHGTRSRSGVAARGA